MENPATWTKVEDIISQVIGDDRRDQAMGFGGTQPSLKSRIVNTLFNQRQLALNARREQAEDAVQTVIDSHDEKVIGLSLTMKIANTLRKIGALR